MKPFDILQGDSLEVLRTLPDGSVNCCVTSPPYYGLRDYGTATWEGGEPDCEHGIVRRGHGEEKQATSAGTSRDSLAGLQSCRKCGAVRIDQQFGLERTPSIGSCGAPSRNVAGLKPKDLIGIPWMLAFALRSSGWYLRQDIIWSKPNPMPESVRDRCTKAHEYVFLLSKSQRYRYDADTIKEQASDKGRVNGREGREEPEGARPPNSHPRTLARLDYTELGRNKRSVWSLTTQATPEAHFATFPIELPELCIKAGCPEGGTVLDPFAGAGTTGLACLKNGRNFLGIELNPAYIEIANTRARKYYPLLMEAAS